MADDAVMVRNSISILTGNFLNKLISIVVLLALANYLEPAQFGQFSFVTAYILFFGIFTDLGLNLFMTREISSGSIEPEVGFGHTIVLRSILTVLAFAGAILSLRLLGYVSEIIELAFAASLALFLSFRGIFLRTVFEIPFQVTRKMHYPALINFLSELFTLGVVVLSISRSAGLWTLILSINLANLPGLIFLIYFSIKHLRPRFRPEPKAWWTLLRGSLPLGAAVFMEGLFTIIPIFMLSRLAGDYELALYSLPFRLSSSLWIISYAVMISLLPGMSRAALNSDSKDRFTKGFFKGLTILLFTGVMLSLSTDYFSHTVIDIFTGDGYEGAVPVLMLMIWGTLIYFMNSTFFYAFAAAGHKGVNTWVWTVTAVLCALLSLILIPSYSHMGAALSFVVSLGGGAALNAFMFYRLLGINVLPVVSKFLLSTVLAAAIMFSGVLPSAASLVAGLLVFTVSALLMKVFPFMGGSVDIYYVSTELDMRKKT